jgi:hypothetical protein
VLRAQPNARPSASQSLPRLGCLWGTFSPSRCQISETCSCARTCCRQGDARGLEVLLQNELIQRQIGNRLAQPAVLKLKVLQALHLLDLQPTELLAPPILRAGMQGNAESIPARVGRTLFLGYMHDSLYDIRANLRTRLDNTGFKIMPPVDDDPVDEATVRSAFEKYLAVSDAVILVANQNSELWPKGQDGGPLGLQFQLAKQYRVPVHLWLQTKDLNIVKNQKYRSFLANVEANARDDADILIHADDIDAFIKYINGKLDTAPKQAGGAEQLAVVCSNARTGQAIYDEFHHTVTEALREAERSSIIPDDDSGQIRLVPLQDDISRADTVVVVCFDQDWCWANRIIQQLGHMMSDQSAKTRIFVTGPEDRKRGKFVPPFKFRTVVGVTPDNRVPINQVADEIKRIVGGIA